MNKSLVGRALILWALIGGLAAAPAHAQLGKLKNKIKEQVAGKPKATTSAPASAVAANSVDGSDPTHFYTTSNQVPITADIVERFIKGLRAEFAERDRIAAASSTDPNVVSYFRLYERRAKCDSIEKSFDVEQKRLEKQMQTASTGEQLQAAVQRMQKLATDRNSFNRTKCEGAKPEMVQSFFDNLRIAQASMDGVGAAAAGLSKAQYAYLRERIVALALMGGAFHDKAVGYSSGEIAAVRARGSVLVSLLSRDFNANGERKPTGEI